MGEKLLRKRHLGRKRRHRCSRTRHSLFCLQSLSRANLVWFPFSTYVRTCIGLVLIDKAVPTETHERSFVMALSSAKESPSIPIVDLTEGDLESMKRIKEACSTTGFFFLAGHGLEE